MPSAHSVSPAHCSAVANLAARPAATGSIAERRTVRERSCCGRSVPASRQRMTWGSYTFHSTLGRTVTPTRRRDSTRRIDSRTRTASRITERDTSNRCASSSVRRTLPGGYSPAVMAGPRVSSTWPCRPRPGVLMHSEYGSGHGPKSQTYLSHSLEFVVPNAFQCGRRRMAASDVEEDSEAVMRTPHVVVVMGVAGTGKTTIGPLLAARLGVPYAEGDDFHPPANIAKMSAGTPLDDADRWPWL